MAQWTTVDPNTLLPGDPWTSAKAQAAFENLEAVTEGATGAPKVKSEGLDLFVGVAAAVAGETTYIDLDRVDKVLISVTDNKGYFLSTDNGATFDGGSTVNIPGAVISLGSAHNAIKVGNPHTIIGVSGVKP